ncbi:hypothetical protein N7533_008836 [Penicillium manginii]|jgi:ribonuclease HI|uniref:uncharacterized protein n=1 Tax=Penicillium manginii TaxID=203109 RepID=UPI0025491281|nr:uncharacterized protein N7533_008836 [Penicillium manginii]KAJ5743966.1 hypothetical protein N7533_008836 [Penicillium manginii]
MPKLEAAVDSISLESKPTPTSHDRRFMVERYPKNFSMFEVEAKVGNWTYLACPDSPVICEDCKNHPGHVDCIVVAIDSIHPNIPQVNKKISIAVFYGHENLHNFASTFEEEHPTAQVASLKACSAALARTLMLQMMWKSEKAADINGKKKSWPLHTLVIKSDSEYLVKGVTEWLPKWKSNGWKNCKGQAVANESTWRLIDSMIEELGNKTTVEFWLVNKEMNEKAHALAVFAAEQF